MTFLTGALPAYANPLLSEKRAEARRVKAELDELDKRVEIAAEDYNEARMRYGALVSEIATTRKQLAATVSRIETLQGYLAVRANSMYRAGPLTFMEVLFGTSDFKEFATTVELFREINREEAKKVALLKEEREKAERYQAELAVKQTQAKAVLDTMAARKKAIENELANRKRMLAGLESEIAALERAEAARAVAYARAAASRVVVVEPSFPPPTTAARSEVVDIARRYLGAPYRWGASGPNAFDCSGFTSFVYRQVGVWLPHSSRAQFGVGQRVSRGDLQPGDLVFFGSPIHHVGIYVGGGSYIHAPRTGDVVKISPMSRSDYVGATRP